MTGVSLDRPDIVRTCWLKPLGWLARRGLLRQGTEAVSAPNYQPNLAVIVRTKNDVVGLGRILDHVHQEQKNYLGRIDVVVVDTESNDGTRQLALDSGAILVPITQAEFTYPKSVNYGFEVVGPDVEAVFITVGHAQPCLSNCLSAGARHFANKNVAGVFADCLPSEFGDWQNQLSLNYLAPRLNKPARPIKKFYQGALANTGCMVRMSLWRQHVYSLDYAGGGEDQEWGKWAMSKGYQIMYDPAVSVHHGHRLSIINNLRQLRHWKEVYSKPTAFGQDTISKRRPDLFE